MEEITAWMDGELAGTLSGLNNDGNSCLNDVVKKCRDLAVDEKHEAWEICLILVQVQSSPSGMLACQLI